jgi:hypothetical protein
MNRHAAFQNTVQVGSNLEVACHQLAGNICGRRRRRRRRRRLRRRRRRVEAVCVGERTCDLAYFIISLDFNMYTTLSTPAPVCKVKCTSANKLRVKPPSMIANSFPQTNSSLCYLVTHISKIEKAMATRPTIKVSGAKKRPHSHEVKETNTRTEENNTLIHHQHTNDGHPPASPPGSHRAHHSPQLC